MGSHDPIELDFWDVPVVLVELSISFALTLTLSA